MYWWTIWLEGKRTRAVATTDEIFRMADEYEDKGRGLKIKRGRKVK